MNANAKRAFSALATVAVLTATLFGVVGLTAVPVSAEVWDTLQMLGLSPVSGHAGDTLSFSAQVKRCTGERGGLASCVGLPGSTVTFRSVSSSGTIIQVQNVVTDSNGFASASFTFSNAGQYAVRASITGGITESKSVTITIPQSSIIPLGDGTPTAGTGDGTPTAGTGDGTPTAGTGDGTSVVPTQTPSTSGVIEDLTSQAEAATGLGSDVLLIAFGLAIIILLAIIAAVLFMRQRGKD